jgi:hypothetical protein
MRTRRTLRTAGITREREGPGVDISSVRTGAYGISGVAEVKANMQRVLTSAGYIMYRRTNRWDIVQPQEPNADTPQNTR